MITMMCPHCGVPVRLEHKLVSCVDHCDRCHDPFIKTRKDQRFCSEACGKAFIDEAARVRECTDEQR